MTWVVHRSVAARFDVLARVVSLVVLVLCAGLLAGVSVASAHERNPECLSCHAGMGQDFSVVAVDMMSACAKCHTPGLAGTHPYHNAAGNCGAVCHRGRGWGESLQYAVPRVLTAEGSFASAESPDTDAASLHVIHSVARWPATASASVSKCGSCHAPAACSTCHVSGPLPIHEQHSATGDPALTAIPAAMNPQPPWSGVMAHGIIGEDQRFDSAWSVTSQCASGGCHDLASTASRQPRTVEDFSHPAYPQYGYPTPNVVVKSTGWYSATGSAFTAGSAAYSNWAGATIDFTITGERFDLLCDVDPFRGRAEVYIDGSLAGAIDCYSPVSRQQQVVFRSSLLAPGAHTVRVRVTGTASPAAQGTWVFVDALRVQSVVIASIGPKCVSCHPDRTASHGGTTASHPLHTSSTDPRGPGGLVCADCHDTSRYPSFKSGSDTNVNGRIELAETDVCDACHSPGGSYDGVSSSAGSIGAKDNWHSQVYETTSTLQQGKEKWCVGCHDGDKNVAGHEPAYIRGAYAPPVGGDRYGDYIYGTGYGFYKTGHGLATDTALPSSGGMQMGAGLECDDCHALGTGHVDGDSRTYSASGGSTSYRDGFRLKRVDLGAGPVDPMQMPRTSSTTTQSFALCASCHDPYPFLSLALGGTDDTNLICSGYGNQHRNHMSMGGSAQWDSDLNGGNDSNPTCVTCHNVHGSTYLAMMQDGKLIGKEPGMPMWYWNSTFMTRSGNTATPPDPENLTLVASTGRARIGQPSFCSACHNQNYVANPPHDRGTSLHWESGFPALDWTWEPYYEGRGIPTDRLFDTSLAVPFRVKYYDPDNDAPSTVQVWIDHDDNGSYEASEAVTMTKSDPSDPFYFDGATYEATVTVADPGDKNLSYRFYAVEGTHTAAGQPAVEQTLVWDDNLTRDVPAEYASIQAALDAAYDGNTIVVADGSYSENLDTLGKTLSIVSVNGTATTALVGSASTARPVIRFSSGAASATIEGFAVNNACDSKINNGGRGIVIESGVDVTIRECDITDNNPRTGDFGGGIYLDGGGLAVENTSISNNWSFNGGAGVFAQNTTRTISFTDCVINGNTGQDHPGVYLLSCEATTTFTRTSVSYNDCTNHGAGISCSNSPIELYDCAVNGNDGGDASGEHGGGIRLTGTASAAYIQGGSISGNVVGGHGGGVYLTGSTAPEPLTVVDCDMSGNRSNNQGGGVYAVGVSGTVRLTNVDMDGSQSQYGGGAVYADCPVAVAGCSMDDCRSTHSSGPGGVIAISGANGSLAVADTSMARPWCNNSGGAIYVSGSTAAVPLYATNVAITDGYGRTGGGAVFVGGGCTNMSYLTSVTIDGCSSYSSGGGLRAESPVTLTRCTITDNWVDHAPEYGGGIYANNAAMSLVVDDCVIDRNECDYGAGLYASVATVTVTGGRINDNHSDITGPGYDGGGACVSGAAVFDGVYVQGNKCGRYGGGVNSSGGSLTMRNCVVTGNTTGTHSSSSGGGISSGPAATIVNCTVTANYSRQFGGINGGGGTVRNTIARGNMVQVGTVTNVNNATVSYSDVNGTGYTNGGNNLDVAPSFAATSTAYPSSAGDFHLRQSSACADVATATGAPNKDIDGESRPQGPGFDIGADEIGPGAQAMSDGHAVPIAWRHTDPRLEAIDDAGASGGTAAAVETSAVAVAPAGLFVLACFAVLARRALVGSRRSVLSSAPDQKLAPLS